MNKYRYHYVEEDENFKVYKSNPIYATLNVGGDKLIYDKIENKCVGRNVKFNILTHNSKGEELENPIYEDSHYKIKTRQGDEYDYIIPEIFTRGKVLGLLEEDNEQHED